MGKVTKENIEKLLHDHSIIYNEDFVNQDEDVKVYKGMLNRPFKNYGAGFMDKQDDREYVDDNMKNLKDNY